MIFKASTVPNALKALYRVISRAAMNLLRKEKDPVLVSPEIQSEREGTCRKKCPHYAGDQCMICSCFIIPKTWLDTETCPDERWRR